MEDAGQVSVSGHESMDTLPSPATNEVGAEISNHSLTPPTSWNDTEEPTGEVDAEKQADNSIGFTKVGANGRPLRQRKPVLPRPHIVGTVILKPKNNFDFRSLSPLVLAETIHLASQQATRGKSKIRLLPSTNMLAVDYTQHSLEATLLAITELCASDVVIKVSPYRAIQQDQIRGVIHNVHGLSDRDLRERLRCYSHEIVTARPIGNSGTATITFQGVQLPKFVTISDFAFKVYPYKPKVAVCTTCNSYGHRADTCRRPPPPSESRCSVCLSVHSEGECKPACPKCGGEHLITSDLCERKKEANAEFKKKLDRINKHRQSRQKHTSLQRSKGRERSKSKTRSESRSTSHQLALPTSDIGGSSETSVPKGRVQLVPKDPTGKFPPLSYAQMATGKTVPGISQTQNVKEITNVLSTSGSKRMDDASTGKSGGNVAHNEAPSNTPVTNSLMKEIIKTVSTAVTSQVSQLLKSALTEFKADIRAEIRNEVKASLVAYTQSAEQRILGVETALKDLQEKMEALQAQCRGCLELSENAQPPRKQRTESMRSSRRDRSRSHYRNRDNSFSGDVSA